jgi:predicted Zn-dependent protease
MKRYFFELADLAVAQLRGSEVLLAGFSGEASDFVRFNHGRVRQAMSVRQAYLSLTLIDGQRHDTTTLTLGESAADRDAIVAAIAAMRAELPAAPPDPYLLYATEVASSDTARAGRLPGASEAIGDIVDAAAGLDLVGILGSGPIYRGFANSFGQRNWHTVESFLFDWSIYHTTDKAVKCSYAGSRWDRAEIARRVDAARGQLEFLSRPARTIEPGSYRAFLMPTAVDELIGMLNWGGVSAKDQRTQQSSLQRLVDGEAQLSPLITLCENTADGLAPAFDDAGFVRPARVDLIRTGRHAGSLVSPRTAQEYGLHPNADESESMNSADLAPGSLPLVDSLAALDTGILVGNFHYLNYSDRAAGRVTGLTRFATFWVEKGAIVAPLNVMRFDDTVYRLLGTQLSALTRETEWIPSSSTYDQRAVETSRVPGALVSELTLTL